MALVKRQTNNTRVVIIAFVILLVAGVGYILFQRFYLNDGEVVNNSSTGSGSQVITNFGESLLNDGRFTDLSPTTINISVDVNRDAGQPKPFQ